MKVACGICEKIEDEDRVSNWLHIHTNYSRFLLCDKCSDMFWNIFKKDEQKADAIDEFMKALCEDCKKQPCYGDECYQKKIAEQLKEQNKL